LLKVASPINYLNYRHFKEAFSADEAIFTVRIVSMKDCFVVPSQQ